MPIDLNYLTSCLLSLNIADCFIPNFLKKLVDANGNRFPIIFRPLHEIDGGWFWWTCTSDPTKTAKLFKIIQDRVINYHGMHNLIWVYNPGVGCATSPYDPNGGFDEPGELPARQSYFPGTAYCDIIGIDLYGWDPAGRGKATDNTTYRDAFDLMQAIAPGKMVALCEGEGMPDVTKSFSDPTYAPWLYVMPWYSDGYSDDKAGNVSLVNWHKTQYANPLCIMLNDLPSTLPSTTLKSATLPSATLQPESVKEIPSFNGLSLKTYQLSGQDLNIDISGLSNEREIYVKIFDLSGKVAYTRKINSQNATSQSFQVSRAFFRPGLYIISVTINNSTINNKIIVE